MEQTTLGGANTRQQSQKNKEPSRARTLQEREAHAKHARHKKYNARFNTVIIVSLICGAVAWLIWFYGRWRERSEIAKRNAEAKAARDKLIKKIEDEEAANAAPSTNEKTVTRFQKVRTAPMSEKRATSGARHTTPSDYDNEGDVITPSTEPLSPGTLDQQTIRPLSDVLVHESSSADELVHAVVGDLLRRPEYMQRKAIGADKSAPTAAETQDELDELVRKEWMVNSLKYCGDTDKIYVPPDPDTIKAGQMSRGSCYQKCAPGEDFMPWVAPAGKAISKALNRTPQYVCRKRCKGRQSKAGFCTRDLVNPEWLVGSTPTNIYFHRTWQTTDQAYCQSGQTQGTEIRHYGRYCQHSQLNWKKVPMRCPVDYISTKEGLSCAKCPKDYKLVGTESSGYLCAEPCPPGSTDDDTGSTHACMLQAEILDAGLAITFDQLSPATQQRLRDEEDIERQRNTADAERKAAEEAKKTGNGDKTKQNPPSNPGK